MTARLLSIRLQDAEVAVKFWQNHANTKLTKRANVTLDHSPEVDSLKIKLM